MRDSRDGSVKAWTVSEVNRWARHSIESATQPLWVAGEVGDWRRSRPGHRYFALKDERAELRCVLFAGDAWRIPTDPQNGARVRVFGQVTIYEARGSYQLVAKRLEMEGGEGLWQIAFDRLRSRLASEGLLDAVRKRPLPTHPATVAVVTSPSGAALRDVISVMSRRAPWVKLLLSPTSVQGDGAAREIAAALERAALASPDVIVLCRGGGSLEDLWAFNEEAVARAVASCPVPVVTGIGHEVDRTIADLVADRAAPTPSSAVELAVPELGSVLDWLRGAGASMEDGLRDAVRAQHARLERVGSGLERAAGDVIRPMRLTVDRRVESMTAAMRDLVRRRGAELGAGAGRLDGLSPLGTLTRGYSVARSPDGRVLSRTTDFTPGSEFSLLISDGEVPCQAVGT